MNLIPKELISTIPELYATERSLNPNCIVKLFTPDTQWSQFIIEIDKDQNICYGYVQGLESELGYFSLKELETIKGPLGLSVERDESFLPTALSIVKSGRY